MLKGIIRKVIRRKTNNQKGFSLAELMVAIGILGIGMLIIASAFPVGLQQTKEAIELQNAQLTFTEAKSKLSNIDWLVLSQVLSGPQGRLGSSDIYILNEGKLNTLGIIEDDRIYSADPSYGWLACVEKMGNTLYKFWIFIIREPSGIKAEGTSGLKFSIQQGIADPVSPANTAIVRIQNADRLNRGDYILAENGDIYRILDKAANDDRFQLDKGIGLSRKIAYIKAIAGQQITRENPVISIYQTIIDY